MANPKQTQQEQQQGERQSTQTMQRSGRRGLARRGGYGISPWTTSPFSFMRRFSEEMDRIFEDFFGGGLLPSSPGRDLASRRALAPTAWVPDIEVLQRGDQLVIHADLPGLNKDDVKISVDDGSLIIQGERRQEWEEGREGSGAYRSERRYGVFYRAIDLPEGVDPSKINATFRNGVLEVTMPAPAAEQTRGRRIEIQG